MQFIYEVMPVVLFFLAFKFYGIYAATTVGIVATFAQAVFNRVLFGQWDKKQVITFAVFVLFGGMTLYFHDPIFVKWKPTVIFWIFALIILGSQLVTKKPIMQRLMASMVEGKGVVPEYVWTRLNILWAIFFATLGSVNLYVAYHFDNDIWVNFKFYGITAALIVASFFQAIYLARYLVDEHNK